MPVVTSNIQQVIGRLGLLKKGIAPALMRGIRLGLLDYEAWFTRAQLSGRPGLNMKSGHAARDWFVTRTQNGYRLATSAFYLTTHQHAPGTAVADGIIRAKNKPYLFFKGEGAPRTTALKSGKPLKTAVHTYYWARVKQVYIPKRLTILENYRTTGQDFIMSNMLAELKKLKENPSAAVASAI